jgi:hypothetical protein
LQPSIIAGAVFIALAIFLVQPKIGATFIALLITGQTFTSTSAGWASRSVRLIYRA